MVETVSRKTGASRAVWILALAAIFFTMLLANIKTPMLADDIAYRFSFADGQLIEDPGQIPASMAAHRYSMNGRIAAHSAVQLMLMLPPGLFDVLNSLVFLITLLICIDPAGEGGRPVWLLLGAAACLWIFMPAFGQVMLWLDGSVNYLWSVLWAFMYLRIYVRFYLSKDAAHNKAQLLSLPLLAVLAGAWCEPAGAAAVFVSLLLLALAWLRDRCTKCHEQQPAPANTGSMPVKTRKYTRNIYIYIYTC